MAIEFETMRKSINGKEYVFKGMDAVVSAVLTLFATPMNSLELTPSAGFDPRDLLFRANRGLTLIDMRLDLEAKIRAITNGVVTQVEVTPDEQNKVIDIDIIYMINGEERYVPMSLIEDPKTHGRTLYTVGGKLVYAADILK